MARGESPKERPLSIGLAIVAVVAVAAMCALFGVVASMRTPSPAYTPYVPPVPAEPFRGATAAFGTLGSRDSARAILASGAPLARDPLAARNALENTLRDRGYVVGASAESAPRTLPFDVSALDLDGACGVVLVIGDGGTSLTSAHGGGGLTFRSIDPSALTVAMCGPGDVHVEGVGNATTRTWLFPGLTPGAMTSTGVSADALLAHAEAERLLRRRGYAPVDELIEVTPSATSAGGFVTLRLPTATSACIPFVAYVEGAGRPQLPIGRFDELEDRALGGAIACAVSSRSWEPTYVDDATIGARVLLRAYAAAPGGIPSGVPIVSIADAHVVDLAHATMPTEIAASP